VGGGAKEGRWGRRWYRETTGEVAAVRGGEAAGGGRRWMGMGQNERENSEAERGKKQKGF